MSSPTTTARRFLWASLLASLFIGVTAQSSSLGSLVPQLLSPDSLPTKKQQAASLAKPNGRLPSGSKISRGDNSGLGFAGMLTALAQPAVGREIRVVGTSFTQGQSGTVAIDMDSLGDENALGFSITFDPTKLTYVSAVKGADAASATLNVNTLQLAQGRIGFAVAFPSEVTFPAGTRHLVVITFNAAANATGNADIGFGDLPIGREIADINANVLDATYVPASIPINLPPNPIPVLNSISPDNTTAGASAFSMTLNGSNFVNGSIARFGGVDLTTTFVNAGQLTANVPAVLVASAASVSVAVFNPAPGGGTSNALSFAVNNPTPGMTSISPTSATAGSGGITLTVNGTSFINGSVVRFGGNSRTTNFVSATQLTAQLSSGDLATAGTFPITVQTSGPGGGTSNSINLTVNNPVPAVTTLSPSSVTAGSVAFTLTVNGSNFVTGSVVRFNGNARPTNFVNSGQLTADLSAADVAGVGAFAVTVNNPAPGGGASNAVNLAVNNPLPSLSSLSPTSTNAGGSAFTLTVNGSDFVAGSVVRFTGTDRPTTFVNSGQLTADISAADIQNTGNFAVTVFTPAPGGGTSSAIDFVVNNPPPTLLSISPTSKTAGEGAFTLTANGTGFVNGAVVRLNGGDRPTTFVNTAQLTAEITAADIQSAGLKAITIANPAPGGGNSNSLDLTVNNPVPTVTSLSPASVIVGASAFTLTVNGSNFVAGSVVNFNGGARTTSFVNSGQLTADLTAADVAGVGAFAVMVENPAPGGGASNAVNLAVDNPVPTIISLSPTVASAGGSGFTLTVNGSNFVATSVVKFAGSNRPTTFVNSGQLTAAIPAADILNTGNFSITVLNPAPGGGTSGGVDLAVNNPPPTLLSISPTSKFVGEGAFTLTANGAGFVNGAVVRLNGSERPTTFVNASQLTAQVSASDIQDAGLLAIAVENPAPGGGTSSSLDLTVNNPAPAMTTLSPTSAIAGSSAFTLTINGSNFVPSSVVKFDGTARTTTFVNSTQLTASVTALDVASAGGFNVTVENPPVGGGTSNAINFVINNPVPALSSLSPTTVSAGDAAFPLTVNGSNFVDGSVARVNGNNRPTSFVDTSHLTVQIPALDIASAGTLSIEVFNPAPGGGLSGSLNVTVDPPASGTRTVRVVNMTTLAGSTINVNLEMVAQGNENSWGFSLLFDSSHLTFVSATIGSDVPTASLLVNSNAAAGHVGIAESLPAGESLSPGVRQILSLTFNVLPNTSPGSLSLTFDDFPIAREVVNVNAGFLTTAYTSGALTIAQGYEADVTPSPNGNTDGTVTVQDWAQVGRFMALLDSVTMGSEYQRTDCAPAETSGDGRLSVADWTQAGRYAAHLDPVALAAGPLSPTPPTAALRIASAETGDTQTVVNMSRIGSAADQQVFTISLDASGVENAVGFSLLFDPNRLSFLRAERQAGATEGMLQINSKGLSKGRVGLALALPANQAFSAGSQELLTITFRVLEGVVDSTGPEFADLPIGREVADLKASPMRAAFVSAIKGNVNPIDEPQFFVEQHYLDFLDRQPDSAGLEYWTEQISSCGSDMRCLLNRRIRVSAAFFVEREFQQTGFFIHRLYKVLLGRRPTYAEFTRERSAFDGPGDLETNKRSLVQSLLGRADLEAGRWGNLSNEKFVDALLAITKQGTGLDLSSERQGLIAASVAGDRAAVVIELTNNPRLSEAEYNSAFVLSEYFGYLRRDPDQGGYDFWLNVLNNRVPNNYQSMVCAFLTSEEYQRRFGSVVSHTNAECGP